MKIYKKHLLIIDIYIYIYILIDSDGNMYLTFDSSREINTKITCSNNVTFSKVNVKLHRFVVYGQRSNRR